MIALSFLASLAFGQDTPVLEAPVLVEPDAPSLAEGIQKLPRGSLVVIANEDGALERFTVAGKSWILPDSHYREAIIKAKQLGIYQPALEACTEKSLAWQKRSFEAWDACEAQFDGDELLIASQVQTIATWEAKAYGFKDQRDTARRQRNIAWAVTGGIILGASTVIVVAVAP